MACSGKGPQSGKAARRAGGKTIFLAVTLVLFMALLADMGVVTSPHPAVAAAARAGAASFGPGDPAWDSYYADPSNEGTWAAFCQGGGGSLITSADGVPACGPTPSTGGTDIYLPDTAQGSPGGPVAGFQCVELAERYLYVKYGWAPIDGTNGAQVVKNYAAQDHASITVNGTAGHSPVPGDVMSFSGTSGFSDIGHVAIVTAASVNRSGNGTVTVVGENQNRVSGYDGYTAGAATMTVTNWNIKTFDKNAHIEWLDTSKPPPSTVYVANGVVSALDAPGTVTPINAATGKAGLPIIVGVGPQAIAITPDWATAYVVCYNPDAVVPINTATNTAGAWIPVGDGPVAIAITPAGQAAYVVNQTSGTVTPIDTTTNAAGKPIKVGQSPIAIAITPNGKTAYVVNSWSNTVTPISVATNTPGKPIKVGEFPVAIAITPNGKTAYVVNDFGDTVTPIRTATNTAGRAIKAGIGPGVITIAPNGKTAYIADPAPTPSAAITASTP